MALVHRVVCGIQDLNLEGIRRNPPFTLCVVWRPTRLLGSYASFLKTTGDSGLKKIILGFIASILIAFPAFAQKYKKEIMTHIIDPCLKAGLPKKKLPKHMPLTKTIDLVKILNEEEIKELVKDMSKILKGKKQKTRKKLYHFLKTYCIESMADTFKQIGQK